MAALSLSLCFDPDALRAKDRGALLPDSILLLPELADGGYARIAAGGVPHTRDDDTVQTLRDFSRRHALCLVGGSIWLADPGGRTSNTSLVFRNGRLVHRYDKVHLFAPCGDDRYFSPGVPGGVFTVTAGGTRLRCGVVICYDLRFPELIRLLAAQGMQLLFVPARWPAVRDDAWRALLKARAIENQIFVAGCNAAGPEGGPSYVFNPLGREIASTREQPGATFLHVDLDVQALTEARAVHRNLRDAIVLRQLIAGVSRSRRRVRGGRGK
jgi:predicted amidohydrolase